MKHIWTIICQQAIINSETKTINLMDIVEEIIFKPVVEPTNDKIAFPFKFEIVSYWMRDGDKEKSVEYLIETIDPNGKKIVEKQYKMDYPFDSNGKKRMRSLIKSDVFIFTVDGQYLFNVKMKEGKAYKNVAEIPIEVKLQKI